MKFSFNIGGYFDSNFEVVLNNNELHFFIFDNPMYMKDAAPSHIISIDGSTEWQQLIQYMNGIKWKETYEANILDGIQWQLIFENDHKKIKSYAVMLTHEILEILRSS